MLAHDLARTLAIGKKRWVGNIALQLFEAFAFQLDKGIQVHKSVAAAVSAAEKAFAAGKRLYRNLSFFLSPRGFGATVTSGKFLHASGGIHKLLFAGEKWMTSSTNTDLNIAAGGAGVIHRTACANDIGLVVFWMDVSFHLQNGARNLIARSRARK